MDTRLRTGVRAGGSRLRYQQFDYSSSHPERAHSKELMSQVPDHSDCEPHARVEALMTTDEQPLPPEPANRSPSMGLSHIYLKRTMLTRQQQNPKYR